jgi:hypothetical protein
MPNKQLLPFKKSLEKMELERLFQLRFEEKFHIVKDGNVLSANEVKDRKIAHILHVFVGESM